MAKPGSKVRKQAGESVLLLLLLFQTSIKGSNLIFASSSFTTNYGIHGLCNPTSNCVAACSRTSLSVSRRGFPSFSPFETDRHPLVEVLSPFLVRLVVPFFPAHPGQIRRISKNEVNFLLRCGETNQRRESRDTRRPV